MTKPLQDMTRAELRTASDRAHKVYMRASDALIAAGRGTEQISETYGKGDPLSRALVNASETCRFLNAERERRMAWHGSEHRIIHEGA